jgi:hypothetical protein
MAGFLCLAGGLISTGYGLSISLRSALMRKKLYHNMQTTIMPSNTAYYLIHHKLPPNTIYRHTQFIRDNKLCESICADQCPQFVFSDPKKLISQYDDRCKITKYVTDNASEFSNIPYGKSPWPIKVTEYIIKDELFLYGLNRNKIFLVDAVGSSLDLLKKLYSDDTFYIGYGVYFIAFGLTIIFYL